MVNYNVFIFIVVVYGEIDTQIAGLWNTKPPLQYLKKAIWQYSSRILKVILLFGSVILPPVYNLKKKIKNVDKCFHREKVMVVCPECNMEQTEMSNK